MNGTSGICVTVCAVFEGTTLSASPVSLMRHPRGPSCDDNDDPPPPLVSPIEPPLFSLLLPYRNRETTWSELGDGLLHRLRNRRVVSAATAQTPEAANGLGNDADRRLTSGGVANSFPVEELHLMYFSYFQPEDGKPSENRKDSVDPCCDLQPHGICAVVMLLLPPTAPGDAPPSEARRPPSCGAKASDHMRVDVSDPFFELKITVDIDHRRARTFSVLSCDTVFSLVKDVERAYAENGVRVHRILDAATGAAIDPDEVIGFVLGATAAVVLETFEALAAATSVGRSLLESKDGSDPLDRARAGEERPMAQGPFRASSLQPWRAAGTISRDESTRPASAAVSRPASNDRPDFLASAVTSSPARELTIKCIGTVEKPTTVKVEPKEDVVDADVAVSTVWIASRAPSAAGNDAASSWEVHRSESPVVTLSESGWTRPQHPKAAAFAIHSMDNITHVTHDANPKDVFPTLGAPATHLYSYNVDHQRQVIHPTLAPPQRRADRITALPHRIGGPAAGAIERIGLDLGDVPRITGVIGNGESARSVGQPLPGWQWAEASLRHEGALSASSACVAARDVVRFESSVMGMDHFGSAVARGHGQLKRTRDGGAEPARI